MEKYSFVLACVSGVLSLVAIVLTYISYRQDKKEAFQIEAQKLISQKDVFLNAFIELSLKDDNSMKYDQETKDYCITELVSNYCNAYESACNLYLEGAIEKRLFKQVFHSEIRAICKNEGIANLLDTPILFENDDTYLAIKKVGKEWGIISE